MIELKKIADNDLPLLKKWLYTPHVAKWYHNPLDWIYEVENRNGEFKWIHHFIAFAADNPIGFCQYYACDDSDEPWAGYKTQGGAYSIDYLIGETDFLRRGFGKQIVSALIERILLHDNAKLIVVEPERENTASRSLLLSCGFSHDSVNDMFVKKLR